MTQLQLFEIEQDVSRLPLHDDPHIRATVDFNSAPFDHIFMRMWLRDEPYGDRPGYSYFDRDREALVE